MPDGFFLTAFGALGILTVVVFYPLSLLMRCRKQPPPPPEPAVWPRVVMITAARNAEALIDAKIKNFHELDYPPDRLTLLVASDASTDATCQIVERVADPRIQCIEQKEWRGKAAVLNLAVPQTDADLLLFSDADALLTPSAVRKLARHFSDPQVGGVCGQRRVVSGTEKLRDAQQTYINLDSRLKQIESMRGRIGSNDGKVHMIRRALYLPVPLDVMDDLYVGLSMVAQGMKFLFEPEAVAEVKIPSRNVRHEIHRRHRMVILSLTAIFQMRRVLNPFRFGGFSIGLLINKVGRRLLPFFLLMLLAGALWMTLASSVTAPILSGAAILFLLLAGTGGIANGLHSERGLKPFRIAQYVLAGFIGTGWGVIDFVIGRRLSCAWDPKKSERG